MIVLLSLKTLHIGIFHRLVTGLNMQTIDIKKNKTDPGFRTDNDPDK